MRRTLTYSLITLCALVMVGCSGRRNGKATAFQPHAFPPVPEPPAVIVEPQEKAEYVISNYWNKFLSQTYPCDTNVVNGVLADDLEKAFGTYVTFLEGTCPIDFGRKAMAGFFDKVEKFQASDTSSNVFGFFEKMVPKYLYDPNSPVRNEDLYLPYVSRLAVSEYSDPDFKPSYSFETQMCSLNMIGSPAADFTFTDLSGKRHTLYSVKAGTTLLFFTNPGCPACKEIMESLTSDEEISALVASGRLAVVNIYIDDELDKWREYASVYPKNWYNGYDQSYIIRSDVTYNVRAIPSLYVLDSEKKVIMKDAPVEVVLPYLETLK
mgnify:FL=1